MAGETDWPDLPVEGYITGRPATTEDVEAGNAVFSMKVDDQYVGKPVDIPIPQYAFLLDDETGNKEPVIVVQAENNGEITAIGYIRIRDGEIGIASIEEFRFIGRDKP